MTESEDDARAVECARLRLRSCRNDALIACMAFTCFTEVAAQPVPPVIPMIMYMVRDQPDMLDVMDDKHRILSEPNWHREAWVRCDKYWAAPDGNLPMVASRISGLWCRSTSAHQLEGFSFLHDRIRLLLGPATVMRSPVLRALTRLSRLSLTFVDSAMDGAWPMLPNLKDLSLSTTASDCLKEAHLMTCLPSAPHVTRLHVNSDAVASLDFLALARLLTTLVVRSSTLEDITGLKHCPQLKTLFLRGCPRVRDISVLTSSRNLVSLSVDTVACQHNSLADVIGVAMSSLRNLTVTDISRNAAEAINVSASPLYVDATFNKESSVMVANVMPKLTSLFLCEVPLAALPTPTLGQGLKELIFSYGIDVIDLDWVDCLPVLTTLHFSVSDTTHIRGALARSKSLTTLSTNISSVLHRMEALPNFRVLVCWSTEPKTMPRVATFRSLRKLVIKGGAMKREDLLHLRSLLQLEELILGANTSGASFASIVRELELPCLRRFVWSASNRSFDEIEAIRQLNDELRRGHVESSWYCTDERPVVEED